MIRTFAKPILASFGVFYSALHSEEVCVFASCFSFVVGWCIIPHSFFCVCTHSGIITSCSSWLEMVSLIPLHHMSGFICVLCQELMEFLHGSLWKSLKTPDLMWCVYSRQRYCFWLICLLRGCFCFSVFCHIFSNLNEYLDEIPCQLFVRMFQELPLHITASIKQHRRFPCLTFFLPLNWKENGIVVLCTVSVIFQHPMPAPNSFILFLVTCPL